MTTKKRREYERKYLKNKKYRLNRKIRTYFRDIIKRGRKKSKYESILGYSIKEFKEHIKRSFEDWMSWENYGEWEVDHIISIRKFTYEKENEKEFLECWSLKNLRALSKKRNIRRRKD